MDHDHLSSVSFHLPLSGIVEDTAVERAHWVSRRKSHYNFDRRKMRDLDLRD